MVWLDILPIEDCKHIEALTIYGENLASSLSSSAFALTLYQ